MYKMLRYSHLFDALVCSLLVKANIASCVAFLGVINFTSTYN
jgi:hypothetical protein